MVETYSILFKKNNVRVSAGRLSGADSRIFYLQLQQLIKSFGSIHGEKLNNDSILITIDDKEYYRQRERLQKVNLKIIQDIIDDFEAKNISHILVNGILIADRTKSLDDIYVLELFSPSMYQSEKPKKKKEVKT